MTEYLLYEPFTGELIVVLSWSYETIKYVASELHLIYIGEL